MTAEQARMRPGIGVILGLVLVTAAGVVAVPTFPLAAPVIAALGAVACYRTHRRSGHTLIVVLMVVNVLALIAAGVIDLSLSVSEDVSPPRE
jgi:hypothetical protein